MGLRYRKWAGGRAKKDVLGQGALFQTVYIDDLETETATDYQSTEARDARRAVRAARAPSV